jgi:hypothetical protein
MGVRNFLKPFATWEYVSHTSPGILDHNLHTRLRFLKANNNNKSRPFSLI